MVDLFHYALLLTLHDLTGSYIQLTANVSYIDSHDYGDTWLIILVIYSIALALRSSPATLSE